MTRSRFSTDLGRAAIRAAGIVILGVLLASIDLEVLLDLLARVSPLPVLLAFALNVPMVLLKVVRWVVLLAGRGIGYPPRRAWDAYLSGLFAGLATPGRVGEIARALQLRRDRTISLPDAIGSVLVDRVFDLLALLSIGVVAVARMTLPEPAAPIVLLAALPLLLVPATVARIVGRRDVGAREAGRLGRLQGHLAAYPAGSLLIAAAVTAAAYAVFFAQCHLLGKALGLPVGFTATAEAAALGSLAALLPITVLGLGTREATVVAYLSTVGVSDEVALAFSLLMFFNFYLGGALLGVHAWWRTSRLPGEGGAPTRDRTGQRGTRRIPPSEERE